jgi:UDP-N-acetylmuramyl pentapeptide synthase
MNIIDDLFFKINKPKTIIITGDGGALACKAISGVLAGHFKVGKEVVLVESDLRDRKVIDFLLKNSNFPLFVATGVEKSYEGNGKEYLETIKDILVSFPEKGIFLADYDDQGLMQAVASFDGNLLTFGFQEGSDLMVSDLISDNFKVNYKGSTVPVWMKNIPNKEVIYAALTAASCALKLGMNLIEISQALKKLDFSIDSKPQS